jgi:hypothetical protein
MAVAYSHSVQRSRERSISPQGGKINSVRRPTAAAPGGGLVRSSEPTIPSETNIAAISGSRCSAEVASACNQFAVGEHDAGFRPKRRPEPSVEAFSRSDRCYKDIGVPSFILSGAPNKLPSRCKNVDFVRKSLRVEALGKNVAKASTGEF